MKTFMQPECEVVLLRMADIITESCGIGGQGEGQQDLPIDIFCENNSPES